MIAIRLDSRRETKCFFFVFLSASAAHQQSRMIFSQLSSSSSISSPSVELLSGAAADEHIQSAFEIASYLRKNVVQGIKNEEGAYGASSISLHGLTSGLVLTSIARHCVLQRFDLRKRRNEATTIRSSSQQQLRLVRCDLLE